EQGEGHQLLGATLQSLGKLFAAEAEFKQEILLDPNDPTGYVALGEFYMNFQRRFKDAETLFKKGLSIAPNDPAGYLALGAFYMNYMGRAQAAESLFK